MVQLRIRLRLRRRAPPLSLLLRGGDGGAAPVLAAAAAVAGADDGQRERRQGGVRAAGGGGAQHHRPQAIQPAQGEGNRAALAGDHRVLQDHRRRLQAAAGPHPPRQEERGEARIPRLMDRSIDRYMHTDPRTMTAAPSIYVIYMLYICDEQLVHTSSLCCC